MPNDHEVLVPERGSAVAALCMLPIYYLTLPYVLTQFGFDAYQVNYLYFTIGFLLVCLLFFPFLCRSAPLFLAGKERVIHALAAGAVGHYAGAFLLSLALALSGVVPQTQNNQTMDIWR